MEKNNGSKEISENILATRDEIITYCRISRASFKTYMEMGMPVRLICGRYRAYKDNLELFFSGITQHQVKEDFEDLDPAMGFMDLNGEQDVDCGKIEKETSGAEEKAEAEIETGDSRPCFKGMCHPATV